MHDRHRLFTCTKESFFSWRVVDPQTEVGSKNGPRRLRPGSVAKWMNCQPTSPASESTSGGSLALHPTKSLKSPQFHSRKVRLPLDGGEPCACACCLAPRRSSCCQRPTCRRKRRVQKSPSPRRRPLPSLVLATSSSPHRTCRKQAPTVPATAATARRASARPSRRPACPARTSPHCCRTGT